MSAAQTQQPHEYICVPKQFHCRLLYTNPVCLLTSCNPSTGQRNVMTISWLTPVSNKSEFMCSMNERRDTAPIVLDTGRFVLNVPTAGMEDLVKRIGGSHGARVDKFVENDIRLVTPGWKDEVDHPLVSTSTSTTTTANTAAASEPTDAESPADPAASAPLHNNGSSSSNIDNNSNDTNNNDERGQQLPQDIAIADTVAHLVCTVTSELEPRIGGHHMFLCNIEEAYVRADYWTGKTFIPTQPNLPPYLTFLGSQTFAYVAASHGHQAGVEDGEDGVEVDEG